MLDLERIIRVASWNGEKVVEPETNEVYDCDSLATLERSGKLEVCIVLTCDKDYHQTRKVVPLNEFVADWENYVERKEDDNEEK